MTNTKDVILKLKEVRDEKQLSYGDILELMEKNGDYLSKSTISRVFQDGSEDQSFRYEETIRPIAKALLDIETIEEDDTTDIKAMKSLLKLKIARIEELEALLENEKHKYHEKLAKESKHFQDSLSFMTNQIALKDKRIDALLETTTELMTTNNRLVNQLMECPLREHNES
jgi:transcriptional regulator with XRE-family HTH domain